MAFTLSIHEIMAYGWPGKSYKIEGEYTLYSNFTWLDAGDSPTEQEMLDIELAAAKAWRKSKVKSEALDRIEAMWPDWKQRNCALGAYDGQDEAAKAITNVVSATGYDTPKAVTGATNASPIVITCAGHGYADSQVVTTENIGGNTAANVTDCTINVLDADTFELAGTTGDGDYTTGGTVKLKINVSPCTITCTGHGYSGSDLVDIASVGGCTAVNGDAQAISVVDADNFTVAVAGNADYTSGGTAKRPLAAGIKNNLADIRTASDTAETDIDALTTVQDVLDFTW